MIISITIIILISISVFIFFSHPKFGKTPRGERLKIIQNSPNYKNGIFQNLNPTPQLAEDVRFSKMFYDFFFSKNKKPPESIPTIKTNLFELQKDENVLVWFGHSSYFIQIDNKKILVDPVLSSHASPFSFMVKSFEGSDIYSVDDIPEIDYLFITHDHWDHLDYKTINKLKPKINKIICGLGVGEHFEFWDFEKSKIIEKDWNEKVELDDGFVAYIAPSRHFSGRGLRAKKTIWNSFVFQTPSFKFFLGGDGGYDSHFKEIGEKFGEFDLAILENGQYNKSWKYIHLMPEQVLQAAKDLNAKRLFPVHSSKFALANHAWDEPLKKITELNRTEKLSLLTPMIGEKVNLINLNQNFSNWWEKL